MKTYDPGQVVITFGNIALTGGFGEDSFAKFEPADKLFTAKVGASGEVVRSRSRNRMGTFTVTLMQSTIINDLLSAVAAADALTGDGVLPFQVKDLNGTTLLTSHNAWIEDRPHSEWAKEAGEREWVFAGEEWVEFHGGATP
jgi:hypothetical protein